MVDWWVGEAENFCAKDLDNDRLLLPNKIHLVRE